MNIITNNCLVIKESYKIKLVNFFSKNAKINLIEMNDLSKLHSNVREKNGQIMKQQLSKEFAPAFSTFLSVKCVGESSSRILFVLDELF